MKKYRKKIFIFQSGKKYFGMLVWRRENNFPDLTFWHTFSK